MVKVFVRVTVTALAVVAATLSLGAQANPQAPIPPGQAQAQQQAPPTAQGRAPIDLTGTWVSVVTEDWRWRMMTPAKGDYASLPLNPVGQKMADSWDTAKDAADGNQCRAFGVGGLTRIPGRIRISWQDPNTLKAEFDAGTQTRVLAFGPSQAPAGEKTWQGTSVAEWEGLAGGRAGGRGGAATGARFGSLKVVTTNMRAGYLRKNGAPYSDRMVLTEYVDRHDERDGTQWITITTVHNDPTYLNGEFVTSTSFKKEADGSKFKPTGCVTDAPRT